MKSKKITVIGAGYVGAPTAAVLALNHSDTAVYVLDVNQKLVKKWKQGGNPIKEPGLKEIMDKVLNKNLFFTTQTSLAYQDSSILFLAVPTPSQINSNKHDLTFIQKAVQSIGQFYKHKQFEQLVIVEKSTVPLKTCLFVTKTFQESCGRSDLTKRLKVVSNPEFLVVGSAVKNLLEPDRVVIGGQEDGVKIISQLHEAWVPLKKIIKTSIYSAQLAKLAANAFLAQRVSSINSLTPICEKVGTDIKEIQSCLQSDPRIGSLFLNSGVGFGGSCLRKDLLSLIYLAESLQLPEVAQYWRQVDQLNLYQQNRLIRKILENRTPKTNKIAVVGLAFKAGTTDVRNSISAYLVLQLLANRFQVLAVDTEVQSSLFIQEMSSLGDFKADYLKQLKVTSDICQLQSYEMLVFMSSSSITLERLFRQMRQVKIIFDGSGQGRTFSNSGVRVIGIGCSQK